MIFCATLKRRPDRRFVIAHTLPEVNGVSVSFFEAVDGAMIPEWKGARFPAGRTSGYTVRLTIFGAVHAIAISCRSYGVPMSICLRNSGGGNGAGL